MAFTEQDRASALNAILSGGSAGLQGFDSAIARNAALRERALEEAQQLQGVIGGPEAQGFEQIATQPFRGTEAALQTGRSILEAGQAPIAAAAGGVFDALRQQALAPPAGAGGGSAGGAGGLTPDALKQLLGASVNEQVLREEEAVTARDAASPLLGLIGEAGESGDAVAAETEAKLGQIDQLKDTLQQGITPEGRSLTDQDRIRLGNEMLQLQRDVTSLQNVITPEQQALLSGERSRIPRLEEASRAETAVEPNEAAIRLGITDPITARAFDMLREQGIDPSTAFGTLASSNLFPLEAATQAAPGSVLVAQRTGLPSDLVQETLLDSGIQDTIATFLDVIAQDPGIEVLEQIDAELAAAVPDPVDRLIIRETIRQQTGLRTAGQARGLQRSAEGLGLDPGAVGLGG